MRAKLSILFIFAFIVCNWLLAAEPVVINHTSTDISKVPVKYIRKAKSDLRIAFGHSIYGDQIIAGMEALQKAGPGLFNFSRSGRNNELSLWDRVPSGDLGRPDRENWAYETRKLLKGRGKDRNVVVWSWGNSLADASSADIELYLKLMSKLEKEFPKVKFVYMTGHLDGSGSKGNTNLRNEQIRDYCREHNKILYDFADIESYDPSGKVNYMEKSGDAACNYRTRAGKRNWAKDWLRNNSTKRMVIPDRASMTEPLNAALKARAFWWMLAELSGWNPHPEKETNKEPVEKVSKKPSAASAKKAQETETGEKPGVEAPFKKHYKFDKISDYRDWKESGTNESLLPTENDGKGLIIPLGGKPGMAMHRMQFPIAMLKFKAKVESGSCYINWYINCIWENSWKTRIGIGGIIGRAGCRYIVNGQVIDIRNAPKLDNKEHTFTIKVQGKKLIWSMDGKVILQREFQRYLLIRSGEFGIGGWNSKIRISEIFVRARR